MSQEIDSPSSSGSPQNVDHAKTTALSPQQLSSAILQLINNESDLKTSRLLKVQSKSFHASFDDMENLKEQIYQEMSRHNVISKSHIIEVTYSNKHIVTHDSWEKFKSFNTSQGDYICEIAFSQNYSIKNISSQKIENYLIEVALRCDIPKTEIEYHNIMSDDGEPNNVRCSVKFVDYVIGKNAFNTIVKWVDSLPTCSSPWHIPRFQRYSHRLAVRSTLNHVGLLGVVGFAYITAKWWNFSVDNILSLVNFGILISFVGIITSIFVYFAGRKYDKHIKGTLRISAFDITKGDKERLKNTLNRNKGLVRRSVSWLIFGILSIPFNVIAAYLFELVTR